MTAPLRFGGVELPAGSFITLAIGSANRDPSVFHEPDRLDIGRKPNPHLAFGQGHHACAGMNVARLEASLGLRLFQRSTRRLTLTEAGKLFLEQVSASLTTIQNAVANLASAEGRPVGTLKVSMGTVFGNRERHLPRQTRGFYREYTVPTPGVRHRGARRIVCGGKEMRQPETCFYTGDHYNSFQRIDPRH